MARSETCEIPRGAKLWREISVQDALPLKGRVKMRCPKCKGPVRPNESSAYGSAHFVHFHRHKGCSLGDCFAGQKSEHPHPVR